MNSFYEQILEGLKPNLVRVIENLLPDGKFFGKEYVCASLQGGQGNSCKTNIETGIGSDFATGETWANIIDLASKVWACSFYEAAQKLANQYGIDESQKLFYLQQHEELIPIVPVPVTAPRPYKSHPQYGYAQKQWLYKDMQNQLLMCTSRFETNKGKIVLPQIYAKTQNSSPKWYWKAFPTQRPLYGLQKLNENKRILLVEGEKTADKAQGLFPDHAVLTWSGGANATAKTDFSPLYNKNITIWADNDESGFKACFELAKILQDYAELRFVLPPDTLPTAWDLADKCPNEVNIQELLEHPLSFQEFSKAAFLRYPNLQIKYEVLEQESIEDFDIQEWPKFSFDACPGFLGEFVHLATENSEADPAAVCITALVRFCAEVYGFAPQKGPHIYIGEKIHPPKLFAVICGNSSKARKGTSKQPVLKLFSREFCSQEELAKLPPPAKESSGPLSTGEGLAYHVRDLTEQEQERLLQQDKFIRNNNDKRLIILDEEFASGLMCTKREGNTLSMGLRTFWDSDEYEALTKNNSFKVKGAHINIVSHITIQELSYYLNGLQAYNGFASRFLWICARRAKLVPLPRRMSEAEIQRLQKRLWQIIATAQQRGTMEMTGACLSLWKDVYFELSREHSGLAGSVINRAEAQTLRLALVYALLDCKGYIDKKHLQSALAMWNYAEQSALYIFRNKEKNDYEQKIVDALEQGPLNATELSKIFNGHLSKERLQPVLEQLEAKQKIFIERQKTAGRPRIILRLNSLNEKKEKS